MKARKLFAYIVAIFFAAVVLVAGCGAFLLATFDPCGHTELGRYPSPDGERVAIVQEFGCGAMSGSNATHVLLERSGLLFRLWGQTLVVSINHTHDLKPVWSDNRTLEIQLPPDDEIYVRKTQVGDVRIMYRGR